MSLLVWYILQGPELIHRIALEMTKTGLEIADAFLTDAYFETIAVKDIKMNV